MNKIIVFAVFAFSCISLNAMKKEDLMETMRRAAFRKYYEKKEQAQAKNQPMPNEDKKDLMEIMRRAAFRKYYENKEQAQAENQSMSNQDK